MLHSEIASPQARNSEQSSRRPSATNRALQALRQLLSEEKWRAGDRLPSEPALAEELGVSRVSVRAALAQLQNEGLVDRRHGSGTYVNSVRPLVSSLHHNVGADQLISSGGHTPGIAEMSWRQGSASEEVARRLGLEPGAAVVDLYRVRTSDGTPVTVEHDYFSVELLPPDPVSVGASLYSFLSTVCGVEVTFGVATIEPATVGTELAPVFGVSPDELCLMIKQVDYDADERPVSYSVEQHLASAFDFQLVRQGPAKGQSR
ncbi:GntR family transcriptional regulator [Rhodococcus sp. NPDC057529]|uniref:GntR family transcriptional regulator n=1 Tax=Rhodococcus sp. NPDC057529 TaxID=3346158 RepID=UPI00366BDECF